MATIKDMEKTVEELINLSSSTPVPGLPTDDALIENYVDKKYKSTLDTIPNKEDRDKARSSFIEYFKTGEGGVLFSPQRQNCN